MTEEKMNKEEKEIKDISPEEAVEKMTEKAQEEVEMTEASARVTGVKSEVGDVTQLEESDNKEEEQEEKHSLPLFFVDDDNYIHVEVDVIFDPSNGRPRIMMSAPNFANDSILRTLKRHRVWADFAQPSYDDMTTYREVCLSWDEETKQFLADPIKMRLHYIRYHLRDWNLTDNKGEKVELEIDQHTKGLTQKTMGLVGKIAPAILDVLLTEFEKEALLS